jgi:hypothetical protein
MEGKLTPKVRRFRGKGEILRLLQEYNKSGQNIKNFCTLRNISRGTFHRWKHKYRETDSISNPVGFAPLQIIPEPGLFAAVGTIRIYQPVSAAFLKELVP